jgi:hypothetical protein
VYVYSIRSDAAEHLPASSTTMRTWILDAYRAQKEVMVEVLHATPGQVHMTADVWTSPNFTLEAWRDSRVLIGGAAYRG